MQTEVLTVDPHNPAAETIQRAAAVIRAGGLVAFPTETVYGLGADALSTDSVMRIFTAKGRPSANPLIIHINTVAEARQLVTQWPDTANQLAAAFWPGPLTIVLPKAAHIPAILTAAGPTVALRIPSHPVARALIEAAGTPLAAPSANRSTQVSATLASHVLQGMDGRIEMILDGGPTLGGLESTVVDLSGPRPRLLRPGLISPAEIIAVIGALDPPTIGPVSKTATQARPMPSPGMMERHYAPRATLERHAPPDDLRRVQELQQSGARVGWLPLATRSDVAAVLADASLQSSLVCLPMPITAAAYSARLYAALYELDAAGVDRIVVELPPAEDPWLAIHDRLRRASHPPLDQTTTH